MAIKDVEAAVMSRYSSAAEDREDALCCPVVYDPNYLRDIPDEIVERDYGCGDPSSFVRAGDTVLDLGSGGGKICYIAGQIVGENGKVIGIDTNAEMLKLARKYQGEMAERTGWPNVEFRRGRIQDLRTDLDAVEEYLRANPVTDTESLFAFEQHVEHLRTDHPMIADDSVDIILSNCVLNLVTTEDKSAMFGEMFRVLKRGGRAAISDIVSDEDVPPHLQADPELWSGCISGAYREDLFLKAFEDAGFYGIEIVKRDSAPWRVVEGIEFRSVTVMAHKGKQGPCLERNQAVIYRGPWKKVIDDDGHVLERGARMAVCDKSFQIYGREPYASQIIPVGPVENVEIENALEFDCRSTPVRHPRETKGADYDLTDLSAEDCSTGDCC